MLRRLPLAVLALILLLAGALWLWPEKHAPDENGVSLRSSIKAALPGVLNETDPSVLLRSGVEPLHEAGEVKPAARLRLRVLDGEGRPAVDALVAQLDFSAQPPLLQGVHQTDEQGEADAGPWSEKSATGVQWIVSYHNHAPLLAPASLNPGVQVLQLPAVVALAGRARVDGAPPGETLRVEVRGFRDPAAEWPSAAREILAQWGLGSGATVLWVSPDGSFSLRGLPAGELLELTFPPGFLLIDDREPRHPAVLTAMTPSQELQVELTRLPAIRGRLLRFVDTTTAVAAGTELLQLPVFPSMMLGLEWTLDRGGESEEGSSWISSGHSFTIPLLSPAPDRAELRVRDADSTLLGWRELPGPLEHSLDLGTWTVPDRERVIQLLVQDERGQPVSGAIVVVHRAVQGRTGADGTLRLGLRAPPGTLSIGAFGFRLQRLAVPEPPPAELTVRLDAASRLRLEVREPGGALAQHVVAVLSYGEGLVLDAPEAVPGFEAVRGPPSSGAIWSQQWREHQYPLPEGSADWSDLPIDLPFTLQVRDAYDTLLHEESLQLGAAESRLVRVQLLRAGLVITGRLLTPEGTPISGGSAYLGGLFQEARTDDSGRFAVEHYYGEAPGLVLGAEGRVSLSTQPAEFVNGRDWFLEPARTVWIVALDTRGARCAAGLGPLLELDGGWKGAGQERGPGLYEISGVPLRPGTVTVPGTSAAPVRIGAEQTEASVTVPD